MADNNGAAGEKQQQQDNTPIMSKGMTFEKLLDKFGDKLSKEKAKTFEQKFSAKHKELDSAEAIVAGITKELQKMWLEFQENI